MSASTFIIGDAHMRAGLRGIFITDIAVKLPLSIFYWFRFPDAAPYAILYMLPPLVLLLMLNRLPLLVPTLLFGAETGAFLQMQALNFGWESGFQLYISCMAMAVFLYDFLSLRMRIFFALAPILAYALFLPLLPELEPVYQLTRGQQLTLFSTNLILSMLINLGIVLFLLRLLVQRGNELDVLANSRAQLVADLSHEIKTPVAAMLTRVQVAVDESQPEPIRDLLVMLERNLRGQSRLINRMLDYSIIDHAQAVILPEHIQLSALVRELIEAHKPLTEGKRLIWQVDGDAETVTDPGLLGHALNNIIANAIAHSPDDGVITIHLENSPMGGVSISVSDQGPGIDAEHLPRVFDPFFRGTPQRDRTGHHHGLGLSIAQRAAKCLGGKIEVECPPEGGTCFTVTL